MILRALQLGDLLCSVPAFRALRAALPAAHITLICLAWGRDFAHRFSDYFDDFLDFPGFPGLPERPFAVEEFPAFLSQAQRSRFDLAIQLHGSGSFVNPLLLLLGAHRSAGYYVPGEWCPDAESFFPYPDELPEVHRHLALLEFLGIPARGDHLEFPLRTSDRDELDRLSETKVLCRHKYACIHPGARYQSRRWGARKFAALGDALARRGLHVLVTGSAGEAELADEVVKAMSAPAINLAGRTTLGALAALLADARLLISNDTGVSHVAAGLKVPSVVVVTGSDPARWAPLDRELHPTVSRPVDCQPCEHVICPIGHPCATELAPERVLSVVDQLLQNTTDQKTANQRGGWGSSLAEQGLDPSRSVDGQASPRLQSTGASSGVGIDCHLQTEARRPLPQPPMTRCRVAI
ncbi:MAG: glycosyltransferase family 9 protein [Pirellulales bacterium]